MNHDHGNSEYPRGHVSSETERLIVVDDLKDNVISHPLEAAITFCRALQIPVSLNIACDNKKLLHMKLAGVLLKFCFELFTVCK